MDYKSFAADLAYKAGSVIKTNFALGMAKQWKEDDSPLTATDLAINQMVVDAVKKNFSEHGIISEEGSDFDGQQYVWVCDPVDGTIPFSHGVPTCTFMLALVKDGESILGVVYDPFMDHLYYAEKGKGAFLNEKKISVSKTDTLHNTAVAMLWWQRAEYQLAGLLEDFLEEGAIDFRIPSVGYVDMLVANGEFGAVIFAGDKPWDAAAPKIIVEEAGGKMTDLFGQEFNFTDKVRGHIASNGVLHNQLLDLVQKHIK